MAGDDHQEGAPDELPYSWEGPRSYEIRNDLEKALIGDLSFKGSFYYTNTYTSDAAPSPEIHLKKGGKITLPLTQAEAKRVITQCKQAPFGKGERTLVDKSVRDTWEIDAAELRCKNTLWTKWLKTVVKDVCKGLGVDFAVSKPKCQLYKLLVYEKGSHFLPHQDTEKVDGMFASLIIVLPSPYKGGSVHLSHGGSSEVVDTSATSGSSTTVLSWYTDVTHEIKPITNGYRIALSYNLIHTANSLPPSINIEHEAIESLKHIFYSWTRDLLEGPMKVIYLLKHKYSQANLRGSALKGPDAHKVALLKSVADMYGFTLGLATVECRVEGQANDYGPDCPGVSMGEVEERNMLLTGLVNLEGKTLLKLVPLMDQNGDVDEDEMIPADMRKNVEKGRADETEYEGYQGNYGGTLERWYRRTTLVIWPSLFHSLFIEEKNDLCKTVIGLLYGVDTDKPTPIQRQAVQFIVASVENGNLEGKVVFSVLAGAASKWKDSKLWEYAFNSCFDHGMKLADLKVDMLVEGIQRLGKDLILESVDQILDAEADTEAKLEFLKKLEKSKARIPKTWLSERWKQAGPVAPPSPVKAAKPVRRSTRSAPAIKDAPPAKKQRKK